MNNDRNELLAGCLVIVVLVVIAVIIGLAKTTTTHTETITVQSKERVCSGRSDCKYLIWTDQGVYQNSDAWLSGKFNSSDIYGALTVGRTYRVKVNGWRIQITSSYPNILEIESEVAS
ncbi:hypothetical protein ACQP1V_43150 (plasmid) [Microtetraspora malaysiensis]|uniref:hypothetical protein n=1 Tax=Microtetraspora malaysiensis TaxID=161358 RepID=UPI003D8CD141